MKVVASTADTLACRPVSCFDILVISGMSSWAEQQGGAEGLRGASATSVGLEGRCREARRRVTWVSRSRILWPKMADLSCSALREDSVVASFSLMTLMDCSNSSCSSPVAVRAGAPHRHCFWALGRAGAGGREGVGEEVGRAEEGRKQGGLLEQGPGGGAGGWPGQRVSPGKGGHWSEGRGRGTGQGFWSHLLPR